MAWGDDEWAEMHGYVHMRCPHCGWSGKTDGAIPECGCDADDEDVEPEPEPCMCGRCEWDDPSDDPTCERCGTGPLTEGKTYTKVHTARKLYKGSYYRDNEIRPGDRYRRTAQRSYWPNGPTTWTVRRVRVSKGHGWADQHTVEPKPEGWDMVQGWQGWPLTNMTNEELKAAIRKEMGLE